MRGQEVVARIQQAHKEQNIAWRAQTVDTFKAGNPEALVRGIATTGMATFDVLKRAAGEGRNFVITHEPTFYNHLDQTAGNGRFDQIRIRAPSIGGAEVLRPIGG